jgi:hypothetical protein
MLKMIMILTLGTAIQIQAYGQENDSTMAAAQDKASQIERKLDGLHILTPPSNQPQFQDGGKAATTLNAILSATLKSEELDGLAKSNAPGVSVRVAIAEIIVAQMAKKISVSTSNARARFCALSEGTDCSLFSSDISSDYCKASVAALASPETKPIDWGLVLHQTRLTMPRIHL